VKIEVRMLGPVDVVVVSGATRGAGDMTIRDRLAQLLEAGESLFILNLTQGPTFDSQLLGELVAVRERVRKHLGVIKLVLTPKQHDLLLAGRLDSLFETYPSEDDALESFDPLYSTAGIP
jgi:anti-anti-sigma regulatory factor